MNQFDVPVAIFLFKRDCKKIIQRISQIKPSKIYLIGDGPRNDNESEQVNLCRRDVESCITWQCEIKKNYASKNRGVYENIAGGAKWVFSQEKFAIFLEDDNLPELSFFYFCEEMLAKYEKDSRVFWICGTNYLKDYTPEDGSDYVFTHIMMPCGWASWSNKFLKFYDGELVLFPRYKKNTKCTYLHKSLYKQDLYLCESEFYRKSQGMKFFSWDYQLIFSLRVHRLYGIVPRYNQITNIGIDNNSIHGGNTHNTMTDRFCELPTKSLQFPLKHPDIVHLDHTFEKRTEKIILDPLYNRIIRNLVVFIKILLGKNKYQSLRH